MKECPDCEKEYSKKRYLVRCHFYDNPSHAPDSWEQCPSCDKVFENLTDAKIHHKREHGESIANAEICEVCGEEFRAKPSHDRKVCSQSCLSEFNQAKVESSCQVCGETFTQWEHQDKSYCSISCSAKSRRDRLTRDCVNCGSPVTKRRQKIERVDNVYCDEDCWLADIGTDSFRDSQDEKKFRKGVFERDGYTCQDCGETGGKLNAHHIEPVSENKELATDLDNGVTLCVSCHIKRHDERGDARAATALRNKYGQEP